MNKYTHDDKIVDALMAWMVFLWIMIGACAIGLIGTVLKCILVAFGIENNL